MTPVVLVVEEHRTLRALYARALREAGYQVVTAAPADDVEPLLVSARPDLILLDPECGRGRGRAIALAASRADPSVSVIFNTSAPQRLATDFSTWLADAYTVRTPEAGEIAPAIARVLRRLPAPASASGANRPRALAHA